jgi:hypothetical protein
MTGILRLQLAHPYLHQELETIEHLLYLRLGASDLELMARISPKNSRLFKNLAEAVLVGFVDGSLCADTKFRSKCIDWEFGEDEQFSASRRLTACHMRP